MTVTYDLPGHGAAPVPAARYSIADLSDQLALLLSQKKIARVHLVGISLGGLIAQDFASRHPERTASLVLIDTIARYPESMRSMWKQRATLARTAGMASLVDPTLEAWFTPAFIAAQSAVIRYVRNTLSSMPAEGYALACEALSKADLDVAVDTIRVPTLVLCGADDAAAFRDAALDFARRIPDAELKWLSPARHAGCVGAGGWRLPMT